jgi:WhiB family redox-sensing transcriptional regulator
VAGVDLDAMRLLPLRPAWWADAACRGRPEVNFFPTQGEPATPAKAVCAECPVREPCLAFAIDEHIDMGIWGGQSARDRRRGRAGAERTPRGQGLRVRKAS